MDKSAGEEPVILLFPTNGRRVKYQVIRYFLVAKGSNGYDAGYNDDTEIDC